MVHNLIAKTLDMAITIQQIPAPTFAERPRAEMILRQFTEEGLAEVSMDEVGNVYGCLPGNGERPPAVISAHTDTVFPANTDLSVRREAGKIYGPGIGDNSLGVAGLFGLLWTLKARKRTLAGDLWLVANVCEEGLGDLRGMRSVVERFGNTPLAYIVLEGMALGQVYNRGLGVQRYRVTACGPGGHSWVDYGRPSAIHELAALVTRLAALPLPTRPRTTLNVGMIQGGTSINTIAAEAWLELDLRSEGGRALEDLTIWVERLVQAANRPQVEVSCEVIGRRPAGKISSHHPLVRLALHSLAAQGIQPNLGVGSTDANIPLSRGLPAVCIGLTHGMGAHTVGEAIYTEPLGKGLAQVVALVEGIFEA
jgi:acetylornithine deacetylase/succinyl-diaminopimelate desuccinylase-like protein